MVLSPDCTWKSLAAFSNYRQPALTSPSRPQIGDGTGISLGLTLLRWFCAQPRWTRLMERCVLPGSFLQEVLAEMGAPPLKGGTHQTALKASLLLSPVRTHVPEGRDWISFTFALGNQLVLKKLLSLNSFELKANMRSTFLSLLL